MKTLETVLESNQGLSAHILGVDGWLLRTIPEDRRTVFLRLYEKAIRTALHPDLIRDDNKKKFYDRYIGRVGESIAAMCADAAAFESMAEFVPAAKNRSIDMDALLAERDQTIDILRAELKAKEEAFKVESEHFSRVETQSKNAAKINANRSAATYAVFSQYRSLAENNQSHSLNHKFFQIKGHFVEIDFTIDGIVEKAMGECELKKNTKSTKETKLGKVDIVGASTLGGIKHCWETNIIPNAEMKELIQTFSPHACDDRTLQFNHYVVGFFKVGMILIVKHGGRNRFIKIKAVDVLDDKAKLEVMRLNNIIKSLRKELERTKRWMVKAGVV
jgi:hypothetical protein